MGIGGGWEGLHAWGAAEGLAEIVGEGPALGGDFEDFAVGVGEVEEDFGGNEGIAFKADAVSDLFSGHIAVLGARFKGADHGAEGEQRGGGFEFFEIVGREPIAEVGGAKGEDALGFDTGADSCAGLAALGEEKRGAAGVEEEGARLIGGGETLRHASWFERSVGERRCAGRGGGKWLRGRGKIWGWGGYCLRFAQPAQRVSGDALA